MSKLNLKQLDFNNIPGWPPVARTIFCVFVSLLVVIAGWYALVGGKRDELLNKESKEVELRKKYEDVASKASNLDALKIQLADLETQLKTVLRQLPSKTQMPDLLVDISQTAQGAGLTTELFQPENEEIKEFYAEKPISIRMVGTYHQFGQFVSGVASLPRLVVMTMQDMTIQQRKVEQKDKNALPQPLMQLEMSGTVRTYRYLDEEEAQQQEALAKEKQAAEKKGKKAVTSEESK